MNTALTRINVWALAFLIVLSCTTEVRHSSSDQDDVPQTVRRELSTLTAALDAYRRDYGRFPVTLEEGWDRPRHSPRAWPELSDWLYTTSKERSTCGLVHKKYARAQWSDSTDTFSLKAALDSPQKELRLHAISGLTSAPADLERLTRMVHSDPSPEVRSSAVYRLGMLDMQGRVAESVLLEALLDPNEQVANAAVFACQQAPDPLANKILAGVDSPDPIQRRRCAVLLRFPFDKSAHWDHFAKLIRDPDRAVRQAAAESFAIAFNRARAMGVPNPPEALSQAIVDGLNDADPAFRRACIHAGAVLAIPAAVRLLEGRIQQAGTAEAKLEELAWIFLLDEQNKSRILRAYLDDPDERLRSMAVMTLAWSKAPDRLERQLKYLRDPSELVRRYALDQIGATSDTRVIHLLLECLKNPNPETRLAVAHKIGADSACSCPGHANATAWGSTKNPAFVRPMLERLHDRDGRVRVAAAMALCVYQDPQTSTALIEALTDTARYAQYNTVAAYAAFGLQEMKIEIPIERACDALLLVEPEGRYGPYGLLSMDNKQAMEIRELLRKRIPERLRSGRERLILGALAIATLGWVPEWRSQIEELARHPSAPVREAANKLLQSASAVQPASVKYDLR